jgi:hypothetical protein
VSRNTADGRQCAISGGEGFAVVDEIDPANWKVELLGHPAEPDEVRDKSGIRASLQHLHNVPGVVTVVMAQKDPPYVVGIHQREGGLEIFVSNNGRVRLHQNRLLATDDHGIDVKNAKPRQRKRHGNDERLIGNSNGRLHICPPLRTVSTDSLVVAGRTQENRTTDTAQQQPVGVAIVYGTVPCRSESGWVQGLICGSHGDCEFRDEGCPLQISQRDVAGVRLSCEPARRKPVPRVLLWFMRRAERCLSTPPGGRAC